MLAATVNYIQCSIECSSVQLLYYRIFKFIIEVTLPSLYHNEVHQSAQNSSLKQLIGFENTKLMLSISGYVSFTCYVITPIHCLSRNIQRNPLGITNIQLGGIHWNFRFANFEIHMCS